MSDIHKCNPRDALLAAARIAIEECFRIKWHVLVMEGEVEEHQDCKGPECDCWRESHDAKDTSLDAA